MRGQHLFARTSNLEPPLAVSRTSSVTPGSATRTRRLRSGVGLALGGVLAITGCASVPRAHQVRGLETVAELQQGFQQVIREVLPSVVGVRVKRRATVPLSAEELGTGRREQLIIEHTLIVNGSGMVLSADGRILTNDHVIDGADEIAVIFADGQSTSARLLASDPRSDLAILRVERSGLQPVHFGDPAATARGQWTIAIGNPLGIGRDGQLSASVGVVSNVNRSLPGLGEEEDRRYMHMIQTTAPISPGNSGGPLFNMHGEAIGIVTAMYTRSGGDDGLAFAIPITEKTRAAIDALARGERIDYGYLGVSVRGLDRDEARGVSLESGQGALVIGLDPLGPAARSGLRSGDVIVQYDGVPVTGAGDLVERVGATRIGKRVVVECLRNGQNSKFEVRAARREPSRVALLR